MSGLALDRAAITEALRRLGERLAYRGVVADLYVFGGAAMALAYDLRRSTRDVDAVFHPHGVVLAEADSVALELGLPRWWLNEQASAYAAPGGDADAPLVFDRRRGPRRMCRSLPGGAGTEAVGAVAGRAVPGAAGLRR